MLRSWRVRAPPRSVLARRSDISLNPTFVVVVRQSSALEANKKINSVFSGTTAVVTLVMPDCIYTANAGDSRAVLGRAAGAGGFVAVGLSNDQKPDRDDEKARYVAPVAEPGSLSVNAAFVRAFRVFRRPSVSQLGRRGHAAADFVRPDTLELGPGARPPGAHRCASMRPSFGVSWRHWFGPNSWSSFVVLQTTTACRSRLADIVRAQHRLGFLGLGFFQRDAVRAITARRLESVG